MGATFPPPGTVLEPPARLTHIAGARPIREITGALREDNHPPAYFLVLRPWRHAWGDGEAATRSLSVLASLAGLLLLFDAVRTLHGTSPALWAALLFAVAGPQVRFAQETRSYALAATLVVAAAAALARLERHGPGLRRAVAFGAAALFAMLTHYYAAGALVGLALHAAVDLRGAARRQALGALGVAALTFAAAWGPALVEQRAHVIENNAWAFETAHDHGLRTLRRVASMPLQLLVATGFRTLPGLWWAGIAYPIVLLLAWRRPSLRLWVFWALSAITLVAAVDLLAGTYQLSWMRYLLPAGPAAWALMATAETPRFRRAVPAVAVALAVTALPRAYETVKIDWRDYARLVDHVAREGELVALTRGESGPAGPRWAFQALLHYAWAEKRAFMLLSERPLPDEVAILRARRGCWFLTVPEQPGPEILIPGAEVEQRIDAPSLTPMPILWRLRFR